MAVSHQLQRTDMDMDPWDSGPALEPMVLTQQAIHDLIFGGPIQQAKPVDEADPWGVPQQPEQEGHQRSIGDLGIEELRDRLFDIQYVCEDPDGFDSPAALADVVLNIVKHG